MKYLITSYFVFETATSAPVVGCERIVADYAAAVAYARDDCCLDNERVGESIWTEFLSISRCCSAVRRPISIASDSCTRGRSLSAICMWFGIELHNSRTYEIVAAMGVEQRKTACLA